VALLPGVVADEPAAVEPLPPLDPHPATARASAATPARAADRIFHAVILVSFGFSTLIERDTDWGTANVQWTSRRRLARLAW